MGKLPVFKYEGRDLKDAETNWLNRGTAYLKVARDAGEQSIGSTNKTGRAKERAPNRPAQRPSTLPGSR